MNWDAERNETEDFHQQYIVGPLRVIRRWRKGNLDKQSAYIDGKPIGSVSRATLAKAIISLGDWTQDREGVFEGFLHIVSEQRRQKAVPE